MGRGLVVAALPKGSGWGIREVIEMIRSIAAAVTLAALVCATAFQEDPREQDKPSKCARYLDEKCPCAGKKSKACTCAECTGDEKCACMAALKKGAGTIKGQLKTKYAKKYRMVVYIEKVEGKTFTPAAKHAAMDQKGKKFVPRILTVLKGTTVDFLNSDDFEHNVFSPDGEKYNLGKAGPGKTLTRTFKSAGTYVQLCNVHPEMVGYVFVAETPYFAISDKDGNFRIPNVPAGTHKLKVWCEKSKVTKRLNKKTHEVKVEAGKEASCEIKR